ncbi:MAG TPA: FCD domain-containing protein [Thermovirga lienii]|jgi:GntR family L-lactate dehydrogenase operon transcriptional regulator|nr:FCD domain-containing protein [Thermovirga lienii]
MGAFMRDREKDFDQERIVLSLLHRSQGPVGAGTVKEELFSFGYELSEATVGRFLRELDKRGLTCRVGFQGRCLTKLGRKRLLELEEASRFHHSYRTLLEKISEPETSLKDLLEARIVLEVAMVRIASVRCTSKDLTLLAEKIEQMKKQRSLEEVNGLIDGFHKILAEATGNSVLQAVAELLQRDIQIKGDLERIIEAYEALFDALKAKDPKKAEEAIFECFATIGF